MEERGCVVYQLFHGSVSERLRWPWTCPRRDCTETTTSLPITATCYFPGLIWYVRWRECVRASVRVYTGTPRDYRRTSQSDRSDPPSLSTLHSDCVRTTLLMDFITCKDTWPADLSQCSVVVPTVGVDLFAEGSRNGGSWGGDRLSKGGRIQKLKNLFCKHLSFLFGVFILHIHNTFCNIFDVIVITVFKLNILSNSMNWTPSLFGSRIYIRLLKD